MVDFAELKRTTKIEDVATRLTLEGKANGAQWRGPCPHCKAGGPRALAINTQKQSAYCFAAGKGGDLIFLAAHVLDMGMKEAAEWLAGNSAQSPKGTVPQRGTANSPSPSNEKRTGFDPEAYIAKLDPGHEAVELLGLDGETARALSIGYCAQGVLRGTVALPVRLEDGTIAGFIGLTEARLPPRWNLERRIVPFPAKKTA